MTADEIRKASDRMSEGILQTNDPHRMMALTAGACAGALAEIAAQLAEINAKIDRFQQWAEPEVLREPEAQS